MKNFTELSNQALSSMKMNNTTKKVFEVIHMMPIIITYDMQHIISLLELTQLYLT